MKTSTDSLVSNDRKALWYRFTAGLWDAPVALPAVADSRDCKEVWNRAWLFCDFPRHVSLHDTKEAYILKDIC